MIFGQASGRPECHRGCSGGGRQGAVIAHIVERAGRLGAAAGRERGQARKRVGRLGGRGVGIGQAGFCQRRQGRAGERAAARAGAIRKIERVHAVDADEQHVTDLTSRFDIGVQRCP